MQFSKHIHLDIAALLAGALFILAFAPFNLAFFAPIALLLVFASWQQTTPWRAALRGYLFGLTSFGLGVSWVYISIHDFGGADVFSSGAITGLFVVFWALFPALVGWLSVTLGGRNNLWLTPFIWILVEYWRGLLLLNGFPWLICAYSQLETPLAGFVPLVGAYGTGLLLTLSAAAVLAIIQMPKLRLPLGLALAVVWLAGGLLKTIEWTEAIGKPINVAMVQGNIGQDQKWRPENRLNTLLLYKRLTEENWDSDIIIWPETAIPAYLSQVDEDFLKPLGVDAEKHGADLIVSLPMEGETKDEIYNAVLTLGSNRGVYLKQHLLPFGEYMPWQPVSGFVLQQLHIGLGDFTPGSDHQPLLKAGGYPFITSICYEDAFGDVGLSGLPEAAFLVNVTNDAWFGDSFEPHQHVQIAAMRALETGRFMLRTTNTGVTAVIAPDGKIVQQAPLFKTKVLKASITPMGGLTPYARWGDQPVIIVVMVLFGLILVWQKRVLSSKARLFE
jgi:apolipoprotein N-acyltransferase